MLYVFRVEIKAGSEYDVKYVVAGSIRDTVDNLDDKDCENIEAITLLGPAYLA